LNLASTEGNMERTHQMKKGGFGKHCI